MKKVREVNYDLLRILACIMVIVLHVSASNIGLFSIPSHEWKTMNVYDSFCRASVPIFFMLSGAFLLQKEIDTKKLFSKYIIRYIIIYFVWSFLYAIDSVGIKCIFSNFSGLINAFIGSKYHLWFLTTLIPIYFLQPLLIKFVKSNKAVKYYLILFFIFCILKNTCMELFDGNDIYIYIYIT